MDPPWDKDTSGYELVIKNWRSKTISFHMELDLAKYDVRYPPKVELDGDEIEYNPTMGIRATVYLNKTIAALDEVVELTLSDPKPPTGFFASAAAKNTYSVRLLQPPEFDKIIEATNITVRESRTKKILSGTPTFSRDTVSKVNFMYTVNESVEAVDVEIACRPESTASRVDGRDVAGLASVKLHSDTTSSLAQCIYEDERWTHGRALQHTYVLSFSRSAQLGGTHVDVQMESDEGFCMPNDAANLSRGWTCRSVEAHPRLVALHNNSKVSLQLIDTETGEEYTLVNGLPTKVINPETRDAAYRLVLKAGANMQTFSVSVIRPESCKEISCPDGSVPKTADSSSVYDHLCLEKTCSDKDVTHCCEEGTPHDVVVTGFGDSASQCAAGISYVTVWSQDDAMLLFQHAKLPVVVVSSVTRSAAESHSFELANAGCEIQIVRTPASGYTVQLAKVSGDADKDHIIKVLISATGMSQVEARNIVKHGRGNIKQFASIDEADDLLKGLTEQGIESEGANVTVLTDYPTFDLYLGGIDPPLDAGREAKATEVLNDVGMSRGQAEKALGGIPGYVASGLTSAQIAMVRAAFAALNATSANASLTGESKVPWYLASACVDIYSAACFANSPERLAVMCEERFSCPEGKATIINATCKGYQCDDSDEDRCCGTLVLCQEYNCPLDWVKRNLPSGTHAAEEDVLDVCCAKIAMCDSYACPPGYSLKEKAADLSCDSPSCEENDREDCCNAASVCSLFTCPPDMLLKGAADELYVDPLSAAACCDARATCTGFTCPKDLVKKNEAELIYCRGEECSANDIEVCCEGAGTCFGFTLCPEHTVLRDDPAKTRCALQHCSAVDIPSCCSKVPTCGTYVCPPRSVLRPNADFIDCLSPTCGAMDLPRCCADQAKCGSMVCPLRYGLIPHEADFTLCYGAECSAADTVTCCREQEPCVSLEVPDGFVLRSTSKDLWVNEWDQDRCWVEAAKCRDFSGCPGGFTLRADAYDILCSGETCSDVDTGLCCEKVGTPSSARVPFVVNVTDEDTGKNCEHDTQDTKFYCPSEAGNVNLVLSYEARGATPITKALSAVPVPRLNEGAESITVILRDSSIEATRLSIWVYRKADVADVATIDRRLLGSHLLQRRAGESEVGSTITIDLAAV